MNNINNNIQRINDKLGFNIITIASGKGGVGKTWLASTIADCLGRDNQRVLLFDGDLGLANIDVQLGINPEKDISGVIMNKYSFERAITKIQNAHFDLIAGKSGSGVFSSIEQNKLIFLKEEIVKNSRFYDHVITDLAAGIDNPVRTLTIENGQVYVITTPEPTSLTDAYAFIKLTNIKYPSIKIKIIINMASSKNEGLETFTILSKSCSNFLKIKIELGGIVRVDRNISESIKHQKLFFHRHPHSNAAKDIISICDKIKNYD